MAVFHNTVIDCSLIPAFPVAELMLRSMPLWFYSFHYPAWLEVLPRNQASGLVMPNSLKFTRVGGIARRRMELRINSLRDLGFCRVKQLSDRALISSRRIRMRGCIPTARHAPR